MKYQVGAPGAPDDREVYKCFYIAASTAVNRVVVSSEGINEPAVATFHLTTGALISLVGPGLNRDTVCGLLFIGNHLLTARTRSISVQRFESNGVRSRHLGDGMSDGITPMNFYTGITLTPPALGRSRFAQDIASRTGFQIQAPPSGTMASLPGSCVAFASTEIGAVLVYNWSSRTLVRNLPIAGSPQACSVISRPNGNIVVVCTAGLLVEGALDRWDEATRTDIGGSLSSGIATDDGSLVVCSSDSSCLAVLPDGSTMKLFERVPRDDSEAASALTIALVGHRLVSLGACGEIRILQ